MLNFTQPRFRTIKEDFWKDYRNVGLSRDARLLLLAMKNFCDDKGYKLAIPSVIRSEAFPTDEDVSIEMIKYWLEELVDHNFIGIVKIENREFFKLDLKDQKIDKPQPSFIDFVKEYNVHELSKNESKIFSDQYEKPQKVIHNEPLKTQNEAIKSCGTKTQILWNNENSERTVDKSLKHSEIEPSKTADFSKKFLSLRKEKKRKENNNKRVFILNKKEELKEKEKLKEKERENLEQKIISPEIQKHLDEIRKILPTPTKRHLDESEVSQTPITKSFNPMKPVAELFGEFVGGLGA